jgi:Ser/Thr protein kinase RdoA (MazF antagonist)
MQGPLGKKLGEGVFADVHAWAPGQVVKLYKAGVPRRNGVYEARMTRAVFAAGLPAPEVFGEVTLEERFGIVLGRFDGPTLLQHYKSGAVTFEQAGAILASLAMSVHKTPPPPEAPSLRDYVHGSLRHDGDTLPNDIATRILARIDRLCPTEGLCHGDVHPDNVIMTAEGPRLVDWISAVRAPAAFDLAYIHVSLTELAPEIADNPERPRAVNRAAQSEYARLAGASVAALSAEMKPYLPIARVLIVRGNALPALRERLIQRIDAELQDER